jgi:hypothetical protein
VTTRSQPPAAPHQRASPLEQCLTVLAGTPDDSSWINGQLVTIAQLASDLVAPASYASVTGHHDEGYTTVAASSDVALAVDEAQYADQDGPCLRALDTGSPVSVPDVAATMRWPGFREAAFTLGLRASLSIPLFAGRGTTIAALNLYGRDPEAMAPLAAAVWGAFDPDGPAEEAADGPAGEAGRRPLDPGGAGLVAGIAGAFAVRALIQQAVGVIIAETQRTADAAYLVLRERSAETGLALSDTAAAVITEQHG